MIKDTIAIVILLGLGVGIAHAHIEEPPAGLTVVDWAAIRALYEQHRHTATLDEDGSYAARNSGQRWNVRFDGRGFLVEPDQGGWTWGLELTSFGVDGAHQTIEAAATAMTACAGLTPTDSAAATTVSSSKSAAIALDCRGVNSGWSSMVCSPMSRNVAISSFFALGGM